MSSYIMNVINELKGPLFTLSSTQHRITLYPYGFTHTYSIYFGNFAHRNSVIQNVVFNKRKYI